MAVSVQYADNPQDCSVAKSDDDSTNDGYTKFSHGPRKKPNRAVLYLRNRRMDATSVSFFCIGLILVSLTTHRILSAYMTHRKWINAPITYLDRTCPTPEYPTIASAAALANTSVAVSKPSAVPAKSRICITTLTDAKNPSRLQRFFRWRNFEGIIELTWKNKQDYAAKHGYPIFDGSFLLDTSRPPAWTKIKAVQHLLEHEECDWVGWTDADTIIMNSEIAMESFLPAANTAHDLVVASDNGGGYNSGVWFVRNTAWSKQFLQDWWNMNNFVRPPGFSLSGDNNALKALLRQMPEFDKHVLSPARCTFNSFAEFLTLSESRKTMENLDKQEWYLSENYYHRGDFIAHTAGYDNKSETLRLLLQEAM
jgi:hypothetical protein